MQTTEDPRKRNIVAIWLLIGVAMIAIQIAIGGITRLTGSGLSITEWKPIMGSLPPLNENDWNDAFEKYQQIAQYKYVNSHFTLSDFKFIYFWEWFHRIWARTLGIVFAIPFVYFIAKKYFDKKMILPLAILFVLGGLQGFIGWFMVQSGLNESSLFYVSHIRLAVHFISALILLVYTLWFALKLLIPKERFLPNPKLKNYFYLLIGILTIQLFYGAFMAGLHAGAAAPTWPKMNGFWIPPNIMNISWIYNATGVHFVHRMLAYLLFFMVNYGAYKIWKFGAEKQSGLIKKSSIWIAIFINLQLLLGIFTVLAVPYIQNGHFGLYETLAQIHQLVAMGLLSVFVIIIFKLRGSKNTAVPTN